MVPRPAVAALVLLLPLLLPLAPDAGAQAQAALTVNVVSARSLGCSPDATGGPDLRIQVRLNDAAFILTQDATDQAAPVFGARADATVALPARVTVIVEEGQPPVPPHPGGTLVPCDVSDGGGDWYNHTYHGGPGQVVVARGEGPNAAEVVLVIGTGAPSSPLAGASSVTASSAFLTWTPAPEGATGQRIARGGVGENLSFLPVRTSAATLAGLCDNQAYAVRVVRESPPWVLSSADVAFTTSNLAPQPARVLRADASGGNLTVSWESPTLHDVGRYELHVGPDASFQATADTLRGTQQASRTEARGSLSTPQRAGDAYVRVRSVDLLGAASVSDAFSVGGAAVPPASPAPTDACAKVNVEAPGAVTPTPPSPTPPPTVTATPTGATPSTPPAASTPATSAPVTTTTAGSSPTPTSPTPAAEEDADAGGGHVLLAVLGLAGGALLLARRRNG